MSDAGHASGERAATLDNAIQATRSSAARFADDAFLVALPLAKPAFVVAGLLGAFFASGALRAVALSVLPDPGEPTLWIYSHVGGFVVGVAAVLFIILALMMVGGDLVRRLRPDLFVPKVVDAGAVVPSLQSPAPLSEPTAMPNELLSTVLRLRGDARLQIQGLDLGAPGRRLVLSIQQPRDIEDWIDGEDNWVEMARFALRRSELDDLVSQLQAARSFLT